MATKVAASKPAAQSSHQSWLMKAEPDSRIEKGTDVAFSVDIFAACTNRTTSWEGVRNGEAKNLMKQEMKVDDNVLFYHSNCKLPGIAGLAKIVKEGYPDFTAWDSSHPYFDPKSDKEDPRWFMVDVQLLRKLPLLVPLALLQYLASSTCSHSLPYLTSSHLDAISKMQLLNRGRLSVQRVEPKAFEAVTLLGDKGGWQEWPGKWNTTAKVKAAPKSAAVEKKPKAKGRKSSSQSAAKKRSSKAKEEEEEAVQSVTRRSKRTKTS